MTSTSGHTGKRGTRANVEALRAKASVLYSEGHDAAMVASQLGITERRAKQLKQDVAERVRVAAAAAMDGVVDGGMRAREAIAQRAEDMAGVLIDAAMGELRSNGGGFEEDPQMINARTKAAVAALQFVTAQKVAMELAPNDETLSRIKAMVLAIKT